MLRELNNALQKLAVFRIKYTFCIWLEIVFRNGLSYKLRFFLEGNDFIKIECRMLINAQTVKNVNNLYHLVAMVLVLSKIEIVHMCKTFIYCVFSEGKATGM